MLLILEEQFARHGGTYAGAESTTGECSAIVLAIVGAGHCCAVAQIVRDEARNWRVALSPPRSPGALMARYKLGGGRAAGGYFRSRRDLQRCESSNIRVTCNDLRCPVFSFLVLPSSHPLQGSQTEAKPWRGGARHLPATAGKTHTQDCTSKHPYKTEASTTVGRR